jgi:hypothetical protein
LDDPEHVGSADTSQSPPPPPPPQAIDGYVNKCIADLDMFRSVLEREQGRREERVLEKDLGDVVKEVGVGGFPPETTIREGKIDV